MKNKVDPASLFTFGEARRKRLPKINGRPIAPSTLWRWHKKGCRARDGQLVRLTVTFVGSRPMLSDLAIDEFISELTRRNESVSQPIEPPTVSTRSSATEQKLIAARLLSKTEK